jgi:predicted AlkP superfamily pyrophosphatase or phosphodiesterase
VGWFQHSKRIFPIALSLAAVIALLFWPIEIEVAAADDDDQVPKLVVLVVFDQMRGDYLKRWEELYSEGGFKRLMKEGAWFTDCHYPYAATLTAPGHASLATGCSPNRHGVIANDWYCRAETDTIGAVTPPPNDKRKGFGPYRRRAETFGDSLLGATKGKAKVVSLSIKERAAILLAALRAQLCYWFDTRTGDFVTSPFYRDEPHDWVKAFNKARHADAWLGKTWQRLRLDLDYAKYSGPDFPAQGVGYEQGQTFPHPFVKGMDEKKPTYYDAVTNSPAGNELLLALAKRAIAEEMLGQRGVTDVLCLGFSPNDLVGHCWGPDSQEVLDITLRSDLLMKDLLQFLDDRIGKGRYLLALTADHGICPLPEFARAKGKDAGRVPPELLTSQAEAFLNQHFLKDGEKAAWLEMPKKPIESVYFNRATIKELGLTETVVEKALAEWLSKQPGVQAAYTRSELLARRLKPVATAGQDEDPIARMVQKSFHREESGDVMVVLRPYYIFSQPITSPKTNAYRTTHGSPHSYDTHVPLVIMGPGIVPGGRAERINPQATATIVTHALGVPAPRAAETPVPEGLFRK